MMKIILILLMMVLPIHAYGGAMQYMITGGAAGECTLVMNNGTSPNNTKVAAQSSGTKYISGEIYVASPIKVGRIELYLTPVGNPSAQTWTIQLYNDSSDDPSSKVSNGSCTFTANMGGAGYWGCNLSTQVDLSAGTYHVGLNRAGTSDGTNYLTYSYYDNASETGDLNSSSDESTWAATDFSGSITVKLYRGTICPTN
jgi:hypothetical protein